ncbi:restriction endonuclease subunit S [Gallibacterium genomosp. 3]|uniref:Type I restriction modification DNA specificity domain-containing protein n=1 Tax=Gallibacterium genomosp. 3 TaxID=505345 RepID=A0A1A7PR47_9PAST|nr:restriction endonuclease subunit S [Gallibacterium genomosp. 3]OBX04197.1 hypothetical protein QV07_10360 [Gallibacterium genomosp. 3]
MKNNNIPKLRYPEFTDAWEKCKVGDFLEESRIEGTNGKIAKKLTVKLWGKGVIEKSEIYQGSQATNYYIRKAGQFIYGKLDFLNQAFGIIPDHLDGYESTLDSPAFDLSKNLNSDFFLYYVCRENFYLYQGIIANGSRKAKRIHTETFFNMPLILPSSFPEQQKIGNLFKQLDRLITLHKRKWDDVILLKKALLQKMFPKNGSDFPALRFPEFTDAWEKCKLESLGKILTGNTPKTKEKENWTIEGEGYIWITPTDIDGLLTSKSARNLTETGWKKSRQLPPNSVLITSIASIGKNTINTVPAAFNQQINAIIPENNDAYFILSAMVNCEQDFAELAGQTAVPIINKTTFSEFEIFTPTLPEQQKIGALFRRLDRLITLHKRQHKHYQLLKKALLQQMFV